MIQYKLLKSKLTGDVYAQQVESHPFTSKDNTPTKRGHKKT